MTWDEAALARLLRAMVPGATDARVRQVVPLTGGFSAQSARVRAACDGADGTRELDVVVRRVPEDGLLAPYDVQREYRIILSLQRSPIPVPPVVGCDPTGQYLGGPCLVTGYVPGEPLTFFGQMVHPDEPRLPAYFAVLAAIHALDWRAYSLDFLDEADDGVEAELGRTEARFAHYGGAGADERSMLAWLRESAPADLTRTFLHGDLNPANYLFDSQRLVAVLDWELALIGDPRLDLGFFAAIQSAFGGTWGLDLAGFLHGYASANPGANLRHLDYFEAVGLLRLLAFVQAAERLRGLDVTAFRHRLLQRFWEIAQGAKRSSDISAAAAEDS